MSQTTILVAIGNSDNKLTQAQWSLFHSAVDDEIVAFAQYAGITLHGRWVSPSTDPYQNAGWCIAVEDDMMVHTRDLQNGIRSILPAFGQDSVAWTVGQTRLIPAMEVDLPKGVCAVCQQPMQWIQCPTGGWWAHVVHPVDNHDAEDARPEAGFE